ESRPEDVCLADRHRRGLAVELTGLRQIRLAEVEVRHLEQRRGPLASRRRENRRVDQRETARIEVVADGFDDAVPNAEHRSLPRGPQPQVPLFLKKTDAVLLRLDRIPRLALQHAEI